MKHQKAQTPFRDFDELLKRIASFFQKKHSPNIKEMTNLMCRKFNLIRFITEFADAEFINEVKLLKELSFTEQHKPDKNAKNTSKKMSAKVFSESMRKLLIQFADTFSEYTEDNQLILKDFKNPTISTEVLFLELHLQLKSLQNLEYQLLLNVERQMTAFQLSQKDKTDK